jgi:hypothetical protein
MKIVFVLAFLCVGFISCNDNKGNIVITENNEELLNEEGNKENFVGKFNPNKNLTQVSIVLPNKFELFFNFQGKNTGKLKVERSQKEILDNIENDKSIEFRTFFNDERLLDVYKTSPPIFYAETSENFEINITTYSKDFIEGNFTGFFYKISGPFGQTKKISELYRLERKIDPLKIRLYSVKSKLNSNADTIPAYNELKLAENEFKRMKLKYLEHIKKIQIKANFKVLINK